MKRTLPIAVASALVFAFLLSMTSVTYSSAQATTPTMTVSPSAGVVGSTISIAGQGYPANTQLTLQWATANASWIVTENPPRVTGVNATPVEYTLATVQTDSTGSFGVNVTVPSDYGETHTIQAYYANGTAIAGRGLFDLEPSFSISPASGPAGSPIVVTAKGLGYGLYSSNYFLYWDNLQTGYFTALTSHGATNFTFYASGIPGTHYLEIYQGYPGPAYLNPWNSPPSLESQSEFGSYIPYHAQFVITGPTQDPSSTAATTVAAFVVLAAALMSGGLLLYVARAGPEKRTKLVRSLAAILIAVAILTAGIGAGLALTSSSTSSAPSFTPQATVDRPTITVPQNNVTSGPRISITPDIASVGQQITVTGAGFASDTQLPLTLSTRVGDNILGFKLVAEPLKNVTTDSGGAFSFNMSAPPSLGGIHYIAAGNLTQHSNGTLFIQRTASINATEGPAGTTVAVVLRGVGWDFNTNTVTLDYDNSYIGYGCGFNSGGNVTFYLTVTGTPGVHTIDLYPTVWWGPSNQGNQTAVEYRYPLLTPQDHPELIPSFHFTFLITAGGKAGNATTLSATNSIGAGNLPVMLSLVSIVSSGLFLAMQIVLPSTVRPKLRQIQ